MWKKHRNLTFELESFSIYGGITMKVIQGKREAVLLIVGCEVDMVASLVALYHHIKERVPFAIREFFEDNYTIGVDTYEGDTAVLTITVGDEEVADSEGETENIQVFQERKPVRELLSLFEEFFKAIRSSVGYPMIFDFVDKCYKNTKKCDVDWDDDWVEQKLEEYHPRRWGDKEYVKLQSRYCDKFLMPTKEGREMIEKYNRMLYQYKIPKGWGIWSVDGYYRQP